MPGQPGDPAPGGGGGSTRPPATTPYTPPVLAYARPATQVLVRRADGTLLPNVVFLGTEQHEFTPPMARFRYVFDTSSYAAADDPTRAEHVMNMTANGRRIVGIDERIQAIRQVGRKRIDIIFDGYLVAPQAAIQANAESVELAAIGYPVRQWDRPIPGARWVDTDGLTTGADVSVTNNDPSVPQLIDTDLPARFNPDGKPNQWYLSTGVARRIFADPSLDKIYYEGDEAVVRHWTLVAACQFCMGFSYRFGSSDLNDPDRDANGYISTAIVELDSTNPRYFTSISLAEGKDFIDLADSDTYTEHDIVVSDIDVTGMCWPDAVRRLIEPHGFAYRFVLTTTAENEPKWDVKFYRKDNTIGGKLLYLQAAGSTLVPGWSSASHVSIVRDCAGIQNEWKVATEPIRYEASFILDSAYDFTPNANAEDTASDLHVSRAGLYNKNFSGDALFKPEAYRVFVADEAGEGRWDRLTGGHVTFAASLDALFNPTITSPTPPPSGGSKFLAPPSEGTEPRTYVRRRRAPIRDCITTDDQGEQLGAQLWVSYDYGGDPGLWNPEQTPVTGSGGAVGGTWQRVTRGGWELLKDRIGIELTMADPRNWSIASPPFEGTTVSSTGALDVVYSLNQPLPKDRICFRLTCVIEGDHDMDVVAAKRAASPTRYTITRYEDARDRYRKHIVSTRSHFTEESGISKDEAIVDDTDDAQSQVDARRRANELGSLSGSVSIPYYVTSYQVGDKIKGIAGRNIDFAMNGAREQGESPVYPVVVGVSHNFDGGQSTTLTLQDYRAEPVLSEHRRRKRV